MDIPSYVAIIGVLALIIGAVVYLYSTAKRGRADIIRQDNADLRASMQDKLTKIAGLEATCKQQADTIDNLRQVATQTPAVTQLLELTAKQQQTTTKQHADVIREISNLAKKMSEMTMEFSRVAYAMTANTRSKDRNTKAQDKNTRARE